MLIKKIMSIKYLATCCTCVEGSKGTTVYVCYVHNYVNKPYYFV